MDHLRPLHPGPAPPPRGGPGRLAQRRLPGRPRTPGPRPADRFAPRRSSCSTTGGSSRRNRRRRSPNGNGSSPAAGSHSPGARRRSTDGSRTENQQREPVGEATGGAAAGCRSPETLHPLAALCPDPSGRHRRHAPETPGTHGEDQRTAGGGGPARRGRGRARNADRTPVPGLALGHVGTGSRTGRKVRPRPVAGVRGGLAPSRQDRGGPDLRRPGRRDGCRAAGAAAPPRPRRRGRPTPVRNRSCR